MRWCGVRRGGVLLEFCLLALVALGAPGEAAVNAIEGTVASQIGGQSAPLVDGVLLLEDEAGSVIAVTTSNATGRYHFDQLATGIYRVVAADPDDATGGDALPGAHAVKIDRNTLLVTMVPDVTLYAENNFVKKLSSARPGRIDRLLAIGDAVKGPFSFANIEPLDLDPGDSTIRRATDDGSLYVLDPAGTALLRLGTDSSELLLDTTRPDPVDNVSLTRLLRVETGRDGVSAILALRADNTRGLYRLDRDGLTRLALLPDAALLPFGKEEFALGDGGQVAYVASTTAGPLALFQAGGGGVVELLRQGQAVNGVPIGGFSDLTSNDSGDLAVLVSRADGSPLAVLRKTSAGLAVVVKTGDVVLEGRGAGVRGVLTYLDQPRIGPEGTVVFMGTGPFIILGFPEFVNFFVSRLRPEATLEPLLTRDFWDPNRSAFDDEIAPDGTIALRATRLTSSASELYLLGPTGSLIEVTAGRREVQPVGQPAFGPGGFLFFQAKNPDWPFDRNGRIPAGLFRYRPGAANPEAVAVPGQAVPPRGNLSPGQQLLGVPQRPTVSATEVAFAALFGGSESGAVPRAGLFRVPLTGTLADGRLVATEGIELPSVALVVAFRDFYYTDEETLVFDTSVRRGLVLGQLVATLSSKAGITHAVDTRGARTQTVQAASPVPLLTKGDDLGSGRKLQRVLGRLIALGTDRYLFVAEFSQPGGAGEGLFTVDRSKQVQAVAVTGDHPLTQIPALGPGLAAARFSGFGETPKAANNATYSAYSPAVASDETVAFKARLSSGGVGSFGVFQWSPGAAPTAVALSDVALLPGDALPYDLKRWAAGPGTPAAGDGRSYVLEQHLTGSGGAVTRLFERSGAGLTPLVVPGQTPVVGGSPAPLTDLVDFVLNQLGTVFVHGVTGGTPSILSVGPSGLAPVARQDQDVPPLPDGKKLPGFNFDGQFALRPESARGDLYFVAGLWKPGQEKTRTRGIFHRTPQGSLETLLVESLGVSGARDLNYVVIAGAPPRDRPFSTMALSQSESVGNGTVAFATRSSDGRWAIYRSRFVRDPSTGTTTLSMVLVAQEGELLADGARLVSLDPSLLLGRPIGSGPVFRLNKNGDVAFLATDGQRWGIYRFSNRR